MDVEVEELVRKQIELALALPHNVNRRRNLALTLEANNLWSEAVIEWEAVLALEPDEPAYRYHHAFCVDNTGETDRALLLMEGIVRDHPSMPAAQYHYGNLLLDIGRFEEARQAFNVAIAQAQGHPAPPTGLAEAEFGLENYAAAEAAAREALAIASEFRGAHFVLGKVLRAQGRMAEAEIELSRGMEAGVSYLPTPLTQMRADLERGRGRRMREASEFIDAGKPELAVETLTVLLEHYPEDLPGIVNLGVAYTHLGDSERAKEILYSATELDPNHFGAYINLAAAEIQLGELLQAMQHANKALQLAPEVGRAHLVKAQIFTAMGRDADAYRTLQEAYALDTTDGQILTKLGSAAFQLGEDEQALGYYREAVLLQPENVRAHLNVAKLCMRLSQPQEANAAYQRAREIDPESPFVKDFERWLQELQNR